MVRGLPTKKRHATWPMPGREKRIVQEPEILCGIRMVAPAGLQTAEGKSRGCPTTRKMRCWRALMPLLFPTELRQDYPALQPTALPGWADSLSGARKSENTRGNRSIRLVW